MSTTRHLKFDRNEVAGAFGDVGTDIPLMLLLIIVCKLDPGTVLIMFGLSQIFSGLVYRLPIPVQPLKVMATIAIAGGISGEVLAGGGLVIGVVMLLLAVTGSLNLLARVVPLIVVRGLQFGLGLKLSGLAFSQERIPHTVEGLSLAGAAFLAVLLLRNSRKYPASIIVVATGAIIAIVKLNISGEISAITPGLSLPTFAIPKSDALLSGLLLLALPQIPLSFGNAILATKQTAADLFEDCDIPVRKLGLTYAACNIVVSMFGGIPVCHGSGGLAGHYTFGGRTGGSVVIYGGSMLMLGLLFGNGIIPFIASFPMPFLAILLLFEGITMLILACKTLKTNNEFFQVALVGAIAIGLPYGFCIGLIIGILLDILIKYQNSRERKSIITRSKVNK